MIKCKLLFFTVLLNLNFLVQAKESPLTIGWQLWYPYQYYDGLGITGIDVDITRLIFEKTKQPIEFIEIPWKRHLPFLEQGRLDVAMGATKNSSREKFAVFSIPYRKEFINIFTLSKNKTKYKLSTISDIEHSTYTIAIETGYDYGPNVSSIVNNPKNSSRIIYTKTIEHSVKLLLDEEVDVVFADCVGMKAFTNKYHIDNEIFKHPLTIQEADIHLMFSKKSSKHIDIKVINEAINQILKEGLFADLNSTEASLMKR